MTISFQSLRSILKTLEPGVQVYRDEAPTDSEYPYIIYEFVNEQHRRFSNKVLADMPLYQVAFITEGIEADLKPLKEVLNKNNVSYAAFTPAPYDENDSKVTQFITYVRCINE